MNRKRNKKERKPGVYAILRKNMKALVQFEIFYKLIFLLAFIPLLSRLITVSLNVTGYKYLTVENFSGYLTHPLTLLFALLLLLLIAVFNFFDISAIIYNTNMSYQNKKISLREMFRYALQSLWKFLHPKNIVFFLIIDFILPFMSIGVAWSYFRMISLSDLILSVLRRKWYYEVSTIVILVLLWYICMRWIYSFHYFSVCKVNFFRACKKSQKLSKKHRFKDMMKLFLLQLIAGLIFIVLFVAGIAIITVITKIFAKKALLESISLSVILVYLNVLFLLFVALITPFSFVCITSMFYGHKERQNEEIPQIEQVMVKERPHAKKVERILEVIVLVVALVVSSVYIYLIQAGRVKFNIEYVKNIDVTAHRGASSQYPENSRSAFEGAINLGANWIELDVQQTKDGQIIVMHDTNLKRTTGQDVNIWEMTYEDLQKLEIGSWFSTEFTGEPIMLLSEVIELAEENNMRLNIELKPTGHEEDFEQHVVDIVRAYDYQKNCVVTSQVYEVLKNIKKYDQEIYTVYVMSVAYGNIYKLKAADSFSIKYSFITENLVRTVHNAGKEIYAWTVNSEYQINQMIAMNVDNIITDNVVLAQKCIYSSRTSNIVIQFIEELIGINLEMFAEVEKRIPA